MATPQVTRIGNGVYRVEVDGRAEIVHVAVAAGQHWVHWNGLVFESPFSEPESRTRSRRAHDGPQSLTAPLPATVRKVLVEPGAPVQGGETVLVLEAMKMELPIRSSGPGTVRSVHCREGDLVQPGVVLVEISAS
ncbi:MAG: biotin/lipoyl-containing protein [Vicinamibacterales bacterium]